MTQQSNNLTDNSFSYYFFNYFSFSFNFYIKNGEKCVRKIYKGRGGLFETCESVQGKMVAGGVKNCHIWAYALFEWPLNDPLRGIFYKKSVYFYLIQKLFSWTLRYCNWVLGKLPQEKYALPSPSPPE